MPAMWRSGPNRAIGTQGYVETQCYLAIIAPDKQSVACSLARELWRNTPRFEYELQVRIYDVPNPTADGANLAFILV